MKNSNVETRSAVTLDAGMTFNGRKSGRSVQGWTEGTDYTPEVNPNYIGQAWDVDVRGWFCLPPTEGLYVFGATGCGKSSAVRQYSALLKYELFEVTAHARLEMGDLIGHHVVRDGNMCYEYGPLSMAMKRGGVLLINEVDLLDPAVAAGLNTVLDGAPLLIPENGGEIIRRHPMFRFVCTANSNGTGDESGLYQGVLRQNMAFADRFIFVKAGYLPPVKEKALMKKVAPQVPDDILDKMEMMACLVRKVFDGQGEGKDADVALDLTLSTRAMVRWATLFQFFMPLRDRKVNVVRYSLERALLNRATPVTRAALMGFCQRCFGGDMSSDSETTEVNNG